MSVIQSIREKYAKWAVVAIALALLGFILTDYFQAKERMGGGGSTTLGSINGKKVEWTTFEERLKAIDADVENRLRQQGRELTEADRHSNNERLWNNEVEKAVMSTQFDKAGIEVGKKEFNEWLFGQDAPQDLKSMFSDQMGNYDGAAAQNAINQRKRTGTQIEIDQLDAFLADFEYRRKLEKYNAFLTNSVYYPKWYVEKQNAEAAALAKVSYVTYPFSKISDSTVKVSDKEIDDYVSKHKEQYKQEESRSIAYVIFDASPSSSDSVKVKEDVEKLRTEFATTAETARFISRNSVSPYADAYFSKTLLQQLPAKDSILPLAKGAMYGPYLDEHTYAIAKKIDEKLLPDSVYCRHILMRTAGEGAIVDSVAEKRI
jgi:peptidyl-prolyl cis-trans isomerase D